MKKDIEVEELIKELNQGKVFDSKTRSLDKFLIRLSKNLVKAKLVMSILVLSEQKNTLGAKGILIIRLEEGLKHINRNFLRGLVYVLNQKSLVKVIDNPYGQEAKKKKKKVIVKGEHKYLDYFREELEKIIQK